MKRERTFDELDKASRYTDLVRAPMAGEMVAATLARIGCGRRRRI
jgi:hypothetical protein